MLGAAWIRRRDPRSTVAYVAPARAHALVVIGVEREHALEHLLGRGELTATPQAQAIAVEAPQEGAVVEPSPQQHAVEVGRQRQLADPHADLVVEERLFWIVVEFQVAEVRVGIDAA